MVSSMIIKVNGMLIGGCIIEVRFEIYIFDVGFNLEIKFGKLVFDIVLIIWICESGICK